jgi:acetyl-CoA synthetase
MNGYEPLAREFKWQIPEHYNIGVDVCDKWADEPTRVALIHKAAGGQVTEYTFDEIRRLSNRTANLLTSKGVRRGDRVAILLGQSPETAISHVAVYKMGAIAVPMSTLFGPDAIEYRLADCGARALITDSLSAAKLVGIRARLPMLELEAVIIVDGPLFGSADFHASLAQESEVFAPIATLSDDPALIIYTSGTTGLPKGALHAHRVLLGHLPGVEMSHDLMPQAGDRFWTPADWAWIGGLYDVLMPAWHHGVAVVSHRFAKFDAEAAYELMADFKIRNAFLPPTALKMMRAVVAPERRWDFSLRSIASGGEPLGAELLVWGRRTFGLTINEFYGQTECNMVVSSAAQLMPTRAGKIGRAVPGHEVRVLDEAGRVRSPGELGVIAVRRPDPVMFLEYWGNPQATADKFLGDWLVTGDIGLIDEEGYIGFVGRDDDVISSGGYRIGPSEIENCLLAHAAVKLAGVIGVPDAMRTELVKAFIVLNDGIAGDDALRADIQAHVKRQLSAHEYPRQIEFLESLPMTTTGKIIRRELRERARLALLSQKTTRGPTCAH